MSKATKRMADAGWDSEDFLNFTHNSYQLTLSFLALGIVCGVILLLSEIF
jgi:hypothetical protein